jgi:predicted nucleotidyltransferase
MADDSERLPEPLLEAVRVLAEELAKSQAHYALIGGIAASVRGRTRFTDDVDLLIAVPQIQLPSLLESLIGRGFSIDLLPTIREWTQHHMIVMRYGEVRVDWLKPVVPLYQHVLDNAVTESWNGRDLRIASAEGLILLKLIASRTQDLADIESLLVANRGRLDLDWIEKEWCTLFELADPRWQRFQEAVKEYYEPSGGK